MEINSSNLPSDDSVKNTKKKAKVIKSKESDISEEPATFNEWLQLAINTVLQVIASYRQAEEDCAKEENQISHSIWYKSLCPWLNVIKHLKELIIQMYEKYIQKSVVKKKDINLAKCSSCGYIIGRANLDCMSNRPRWVIKT